MFLDEENMLRYRLKGDVTGKNFPPPPKLPQVSSHDDAQLSDHAVIVLGAFVVSSLFFDLFVFCATLFSCVVSLLFCSGFVVLLLFRRCVVVVVSSFVLCHVVVVVDVVLLLCLLVRRCVMLLL